nr:alpha/beta hydrolase [uncultured Actinoplanes sp.]
MTTETMVPVDGIEICAATFGEPHDPAVLLIGGVNSSMDWWEDEFCRRLAAGGRFVIRYDHRDTGRSTSYPAGQPRYSSADLANDALGVLDHFGIHRAHLVGVSMGGALAQVIAVRRPNRVLSLTLLSTGSIAEKPESGSDDVNEPEATEVARDEPVSQAEDARGAAQNAETAAPDSATDGTPNAVGGEAAPAGSGSPDDGAPREAAAGDGGWADRRTAVDRLVSAVRQLGGVFTADDAHLRRLAERVFDRTSDMAASQTNHFLAAPGPPISPDALARVAAPTVVLHGTLDPMFPAKEAHALADAIPGARLVWLDGVGHEYPPEAVWSQVIDEILAQGGRDV